MDAIFQTTFSSAFLWMKMYEFRRIFHWSLFLRFQLTILHHWFRLWLGAVQATRYYINQWWLIYWRIYASFGPNELMLFLDVSSRLPPWLIKSEIFTHVRYLGQTLCCDLRALSLAMPLTRLPNHMLWDQHELLTYWNLLQRRITGCWCNYVNIICHLFTQDWSMREIIPNTIR